MSMQKVHEFVHLILTKKCVLMFVSHTVNIKHIVLVVVVLAADADQ